MLTQSDNSGITSSFRIDSIEARRCIERVMERHPKLTTNGFGFGYDERTKPEDYDASFAEHRSRMLADDSVEQFVHAVHWLQLCARTKRLNRRRSSYGLKHEAEAYGNNGYISNGMLIAAAIHLGFAFKRTDNRPDNPNVYINISSKRPQAQGRRIGRMIGL